MKKHYSKIIATLIAAATCASTMAAYASTGPLPQPSNGSKMIVTAIGNLGTEIQAIATAAMHDFNNLMFQVDSYFPSGSNNSGTSEANQSVSQYSDQLTQKQVTNELSQVPEQAIPASQLDNDNLINKIKARQQLLTELTTGLPASDTLYSSGLSGLLAGAFGNPKPDAATVQQNDQAFNFDSLVTPDAYDQDQLKAAQQYLQYLTENYKSITPGIDFDSLKNKLNAISNPIDRAKWLKTNVIDNPTFQKYQLQLRSNVAARSLALSNFNMLLAQRIPVKNLGSVEGLPQDPNLPQGYASLQQAQNYAATQLINNPDWYASMKTASPATVEREQLLLLATLVRQQNQNEIYNQRLLATLSLLTLQMNATQQLGMQTKAQQINQIWGGGQTGQTTDSDSP